MNFGELLKKGRVILDGAMGTELLKRGLRPGEEPSLFVLRDPGAVRSVHRAYVQSGADVIYTDTFGANPLRLGDDCEKVVAAAVDLAREAAEGRALVALDVGPLARLLEPTGDLRFEDAVDAFKRMLKAGEKADLVVFETFTDLYELKAAVLAAKDLGWENVVCTMSFEPDGRTFSGTSPDEAVLTLSGLGISALGINCSSGPDLMLPTLRRFRELTDLPLVVKPNAGLPDPVTGEYSMDPETFARLTAALASAGATLLGGCCGTSPEYIAALSETVRSGAFPAIPAPVSAKKRAPALCSATRTVALDGARVIGERINPTGKKLMKLALTEGNEDYIKEQAVSQANAGADILDVNVGLPGIDERAWMVRAVKAVRSVCDLPVQLDSSSPEAIEAGLRVCCGKAIVNSVNGKKEVLDSILPLVKKYGAAVVGLTLDENGIPETAEGRFEIARRIAAACDGYGIPRSDLFIDCLTLTVAAGADSAAVTLEALRRVKNELGLKTVLGVSNISFGLPRRDIINQSFLTMALQAGLDLAIMNPNSEAMSGAVDAFRALSGADPNGAGYAAKYAGISAEAKPSAAPGLGECIDSGLASEAARTAKALLETQEPMAVVEKYVIPALDRAGVSFEKGEIFLPQLIRRASAAQAAFDEVRAKMGKRPAGAHKVIMATVKNDVHDIGKNIVCTLLSNYGFDVIDLGKDVAPETVLEAVRREDCRLVGLSALMTTTVSSMKETVELLKREAPWCRVMVGGAVLTAEYAKEIGADFYSRDAMGAVETAKKYFGEENGDDR